MLKRLFSTARSVFFVLLLSLLWSPSTNGQDSSAVGVGDAVSITAGGVLLFAPALLLKPDSVTCVPCDRSEVPVFDRWIISRERPFWGRTSDLLLIGIGVSSWLNMSDEGTNGRAGMAASFQSLLWAEGVSELVKRIVKRKRPVLYTREGIPVAGHARNQESWPSGHAAGAAALAASYWLTRNQFSSGGQNDTHAWILAAGAVSVAALRVAAGRHFPSDVIPGLALGVLSASVVHTVKF